MRGPQPIAYDDRTGFVETLDGGRVIVRAVVVKDVRPARRLQTLRAYVVLDRDRKPFQPSVALFDFFHALLSVFALDRKERVQFRIKPFGVV